MAKPLLCRIGRHAWKRRVNDEGKLYKECARCEKCAEEQGSPANNFWGFVGGNG
jgi:hypothetical protein